MNQLSRAFVLGLAACSWLPCVARAQTLEPGPTGGNPFDTPAHLLDPQHRPDWSKAAAGSPSNAKEAQTCYEAGMTKLRNNDAAGALVEFDHLVSLKPYKADSYIARSRAKERQKDYAGAVADESHAIKLDPNNPGYYHFRGISEMLLRQWPEASKDLRKSCEKQGIKNPYSPVFLWMVRVHLREKSAADKELAAYLDARTEFDAPTEWVRHIGRFLLGHESETDFLGAASPEDAAPNPQRDWHSLSTGNLAPPSANADFAGSGQQCEARFYCGEMRLWSGDKAAAAEQFQQCVATKRMGFVEYKLAASELEALKP